MKQAALVLAFVLLLPGVAHAKYRDFRTPSGNIGCAHTDDPQYLRCDILRSSDMPPRPKSCDFDYGHAYAIGPRGRSRVLCASDTVVRQGAPILRYGRTKRLGSFFTCRSRRTGLRCANRAGHGFVLSRARIRRF